jgi:hypothetical protein
MQEINNTQNDVLKTTINNIYTIQEIKSTIQNYDFLREKITHISKNLFKIYRIDLEYIVNIQYIKSNIHTIRPHYSIHYEFKPSDYVYITYLEDEMYTEGKSEHNLLIPHYFFTSTDEEILSFIEEAQEEKMKKEEDYMKDKRKEQEEKHKEYIKSEYEKYFNKK